MMKLVAIGAVLSVGMVLWAVSSGSGTARAAAKAGAMLSHDVYFTLKDGNAESTKRLIAACKKHLCDHPGTVFFGVGGVAEGLDRSVNDRDWHVGLHIVFKDRAAHDAYQTHERHQKFIDENKESWAKVRVFDTDLAE